MSSDAQAVHVLHDNQEWIPAFERAFAAEGVPLRERHLGETPVHLDDEPPAGVFWSRLSASAHARGAASAAGAARTTLAWLESWGRRVVNGSRVAALEVSKAEQHSWLRRAGIDVPRTIAVTSAPQLVRAAEEFAEPFVVKPNTGGKGLGVRRFDSVAELARDADAVARNASPDGVLLVQEHLASRDGSITRAEFVGGRFVYAVRVDTDGSFELCPADACAPGAGPRFSLRHDVTAGHELIVAYERVLQSLGVEIAGIEFVETTSGRTVTYDVNTNTNYNAAVEAEVEVSAARRVARFLGSLLPAPA